MPGYDVITIGSATLDFLLHVPHVRVAHHTLPLREGGKYEATDLTISLGGGACTAARVIKQYDLHVAYHGTLGTDMHAREITRLLREEGIRFTGTRVEGRSAFSIIIPTKEDRIILAYRGVSTNPLVKNPPRAKAYYYTSLHPKSYSTLKKVMREQKKQGSRIFVNPSMYSIKGHETTLLAILAHADVLILNAEEAEVLTRKRRMHTAAKALHNHVPTVIITNGAEEGFVLSREECFTFTPFTPRKIKDTTGAGDIFGSTLASLLLTGKSLREAVQGATAHASLSTQYEGIEHSIRPREEWERLAKRVTIKPCK